MTIDVDVSRVDELAEYAVPCWVRGVWQRSHIRTAKDELRTPYVVWVQTPTLYADLRAFTEACPPQPGAVESGFAGWLAVDGQICRWKRPIDLTPGPEDADQGAMFVQRDVMWETGVLSNYLEEYHRIETAQRCFAASRGGFELQAGGVRFSAEGALEIMVCAGVHVIHAKRRHAAALRYGRFDEATGGVRFELGVGDISVFDMYDEGSWTVWNDDRQRRELLLEATRRSTS